MTISNHEDSAATADADVLTHQHHQHDDFLFPASLTAQVSPHPHDSSPSLASHPGTMPWSAGPTSRVPSLSSVLSPHGSSPMTSTSTRRSRSATITTDDLLSHITSPATCHDRLNSLDQNFCRDFACCGQLLKTMHDLVEHYESHHVVVDDAFESSDVYVMPSADDNDGGKSQGGGATSSAHRQQMLLHQQQRTLMIAPGVPADLMPAGLKRLDESAQAFDLTVVYPGQPPNKKHKMSHNGVQYERLPSVQYPVIDDRTPSATVTDEPSSSSASSSPSPTTTDQPQAPKRQLLTAAQLKMFKESEPPKFVSPASISGASGSDEDDYIDDPVLGGSPAYREYLKELKVRERQARGNRGEKGERRFGCVIPGCEKLYRNQNGLKYHIQHSHSEEERELAQRLIHAVRQDPQEKPYACHFPECTKRYRNSNGLKYHLDHYHLDEVDPHGPREPKNKRQRWFTNVAED